MAKPSDKSFFSPKKWSEDNPTDGTSGQDARLPKPSLSKIADGFDFNEKPLRQDINWCLYSIGEWLEWLDDNLDQSLNVADSPTFSGLTLGAMLTAGGDIETNEINNITGDSLRIHADVGTVNLDLYATNQVLISADDDVEITAQDYIYFRSENEFRFIDGTTPGRKVSFRNSSNVEKASISLYNGDILTGGNITGGIFEDISSTITINGFSSYTTKVVYRRKLGKDVWIFFFVKGPGSGTACSFTNLPDTSVNIAAFDYTHPVQVGNSSSDLETSPGCGYMAYNTSTIIFYTDYYSGGWTNGVDRWIRGVFQYRSA